MHMNQQQLSSIQLYLHNPQLLKITLNQKALYQYPYYFEDQQRGELILEKERNQKISLLMGKQNNVIKISRVQDFKQNQVLQTWLVNASNMKIIYNAAGKTINLSKIKPQNQEMMEDEEKSKKKRDFTSILHFGRSSGLGKVVKFQSIDVSRNHFMAKKSCEYIQNEKQKQNIMNVFKDSSSNSKFCQIPRDIRNVILSYIYEKKCPFVLQDAKSQYGTYRYLPNGFQITNFQTVNQIILSEKNEIGLSLVKQIRTEILSHKDFSKHLFSIQRQYILGDLVFEDRDPILKTQLQRKIQRQKESTDTKILSTLILKLRVINQYQYILLQNNKENHTFGNGSFDIPISSTHCIFGKQLFQISYRNDKWLGYGCDTKQCGFYVKLKQQRIVGAQKRESIRMGKHSKLIIDLPF